MVQALLSYVITEVMGVLVFVCFPLRLLLTHLCCWLKDQQPLSASRDLSVWLAFSLHADL